eukprot:3423753-Prymnesium_polylepis.1
MPDRQLPVCSLELLVAREGPTLDAQDVVEIAHAFLRAKARAPKGCGGGAKARTRGRVTLANAAPPLARPHMQAYQTRRRVVARDGVTHTAHPEGAA